MDEAKETTKVLSAVSSVMSHFRQSGMLSGFSGSWGPSHSTRLGSLPLVRPSCLVRRASSSEGRYWWQWWHVEKSWEQKSWEQKSWEEKSLEEKAWLGEGVLGSEGRERSGELVRVGAVELKAL